MSVPEDQNDVDNDDDDYEDDDNYEDYDNDEDYDSDTEDNEDTEGSWHAGDDFSGLDKEAIVRMAEGLGAFSKIKEGMCLF